MAGIQGEGGTGPGMTMELGTDVHCLVGDWRSCIILVAQASIYHLEVVSHAFLCRVLNAELRYRILQVRELRENCDLVCNVSASASKQSWCRCISIVLLWFK